MKWVSFISLILVSLGLGYFLHENQSNRAKSGGERGQKFSATRSQRSGLTEQRRREVDILTQAAFTEGGEEEWLRWLAFLENAKVEDLPRFVEGVGNDPVALGLIAKRWASLNAKDGFRYLLKQTDSRKYNRSDSAMRILAKAFLASWSQQDLEIVLEELDVKTTNPMVGFLQANLVATLLKTDVEKGLRYECRWKTGYYYGELSPKVKEWVEQNPRYAAELLFDEPTHGFLMEVAQVWGEGQPRQALEFAFSKGGDRGFQFAEAVFAAWAQKDFEGASQWYAQLEPGKAESLTPILVRNWASKDPFAALEWSQNNLSGAVGQRAVKEVVLASLKVAGSSPGELLPLIQSPIALDEVVIALADKIFMGGYGGDKVEALKWFSDLEPSSALDQVFFYFTSEWARLDVEGFREYIATPRAQSVSTNSYKSAMASYASVKPYEAMELLKEIPERHLATSTQEAFKMWYNMKPEQAVAWAGSLEADDPRRPFLAEGFTWFLHEPYEEAIRKFKAKPPVIQDLLKEMMVRKNEEGFRYLKPGGGHANLERILNEVGED